MPDQYPVGYFIIFLGLVAISILTTMFIIHFLLRAYWVGVVGLNSVFPDYSIEDSAYSPLYTEKILSILPKLDKTIKDIDEMCSVIFSAAFVMLVIYTYFAILICLGLFLFNMLSGVVPTIILAIPLILFIGIFIFQLVMSLLGHLKINRKNNRIQTLYFKSAKWSGIVMIGPLFRYVLQIFMIFGSNFKKKKALARLMILFAFAGFILAVIQFAKSEIVYFLKQDLYSDTDRMYEAFYATSNNETFLLTPLIDSDLIETDAVRLFIPIHTYEKQIFNKSTCTHIDEEDEHWFLKCYTSYNQVFLNGEQIDPDFIKYEWPETGQFGVISYINLANSKAGRHRIKVTKELNETLEWEIPFHYMPD